MIPLIEQIYWTVAAVCGGYGLVLLAIALIYHLISAKLELKWPEPGMERDETRKNPIDHHIQCADSSFRSPDCHAWYFVAPAKSVFTPFSAAGQHFSSPFQHYNAIRLFS